MKASRLFLLLGVMATAFCAPLRADDRGTHRIGISLTSRGLCGLGLSWTYAVEDGVSLGWFYRASAVALARASLDSGEVGFLGTVSRGALGGTVEAGYRFENQDLGSFRSLFTSVAVRPGLPAGDCVVGPELAWDQTWITLVRLGDRARAAWVDRYPGSSAPPDEAIVAFPSTRFRLGAYARGGAENRQGFDWSCGAIFVPGSLLRGMDGMMIGKFPFYARFEESFAW